MSGAAFVDVVDALASCAVCGASKADNDWAFGVTTLVLSLLPPVLFGVAMFFIVRAYRRRQAEDVVARVAPPAE